MKRLSKTQDQERMQHQDAIIKAKDDLEKAIDKFNAELENAKVDVEAALNTLQGLVHDAEQWRADLVAEMESYRDERSERWQESDAGQNYASWIDTWSEEFPDVELEFPEPLNMPDCEVDETLGNFPDDPNGL